MLYASGWVKKLSQQFRSLPMHQLDTWHCCWVEAAAAAAIAAHPLFVPGWRESIFGPGWNPVPYPIPSQEEKEEEETAAAASMASKKGEKRWELVRW